MPNFCFLDTDLECPHCHKRFPYSVSFQWGFSYWRYYDEAYAYHLGDTLTWKKLPNGDIPSWTYFREANRSSTANLGDHGCQHLVATDHWEHGEGTNPLSRWTCPFCRQALWSTAVEIEDNVLLRAWIFERGDFAEECTYYLVETDGSFSPVPQWEDQPMPTIDLS